ncbi:hypothetical protein LR021_05305 [Candidatus Bipolaricaulota bacterium]|nr:hypothetical protein [Candidatus Bipolaricaulota bacterium]
MTCPPSGRDTPGRRLITHAERIIKDHGSDFAKMIKVEATEKAKRKYPDRLFHVIKVGYPAVHKRRSP